MTLDEKVREWAREAIAYAEKFLATWPGPVDREAYEIEFREIYNAEFARLARADAFEMVMKAWSRACEHPDSPAALAALGVAIEALAAAEKETT